MKGFRVIAPHHKRGWNDPVVVEVLGRLEPLRVPVPVELQGQAFLSLVVGQGLNNEYDTSQPTILNHHILYYASPYYTLLYSAILY